MSEDRSDISPGMLVERLQYKHALGQNSWQHDNHQVRAIAGLEQLCRNLGMLFIVLHEIAYDQVGIDKPSFAHRVSSRRRAAFAAALRI